MPNIRAVLFDYGLVLSGPPDPVAWERLKSLLQVNEVEFHSAYWRHRDAYDRGALNGKTYWTKVSSDLNRSLDQAKLAALLATDVLMWTSPNEEMIAWAVELRRANYKTGILSNIGDAMESGILARCEWLRAFQHRTFSHRLGLAKPDLAIYQDAAEGLGEDPGNILFIDDREENVLAARAVGMIAIQYLSHAAFIAAMQAAGLQGLLHPQ